MKKILTLFSMLFLMFATLSCGNSNDSAKTNSMAKAEKPAVAIVFSTGGLGDKSFNDSAYAGLKKAEKDLGITFDYYEPKDPSAEAQSQLMQYAQTGKYKLIIGVGFSMKDALVAAAKEYPEQNFALIDEIATDKDGKDLKNAASLMFKEQDGSFLAGALAAMMTKTNKIGFIGGLDVPVIQRFESGYVQGAKYVNPKIDINVVFINGSNPFNDPVSAKALAQTLIQKGNDVIFGVAGGSGAGVFQAAKDAGIFAIGVDSNQDDIVPGTILTSMVKKVGNAVYKEIKTVLDGKFQPGVQYFGLKEDGVSLTDFEFTKDKIGKEKIAKLNEIASKIKDGSIKVEQYLPKK